MAAVHGGEESRALLLASAVPADRRLRPGLEVEELQVKGDGGAEAALGTCRFPVDQNESGLVGNEDTALPALR